MKMDIMILNTMKYRKEGDMAWKSRLAYIIPTKTAYCDNEKFRGYTELSLYRNDSTYFDLIPKEFIGQKCEVKVIDVPSKSNPMKSYKEITEVTCDGKTIHLV